MAKETSGAAEPRSSHLLSIPAASARVSMSEQTLRNWIRGGRLGYVRLGDRVLVRESDLEELIATAYVPPRREAT